MKQRFSRTKTAAAVATTLAAAVITTPTLAVNHSDNGLGEVGLIPYYTVRDEWDTNVSVVNTSDRYVVAFKIRTREGSNSREARDFIVFLSPNDVWTATITMGDDGETPVYRTADLSCMAPWVSPDGFEVIGQTSDGREIKELDMTNIGYAGPSVNPPDAGPDGIERAQEGYLQIFELGVADPDHSGLARMAVHGSQDCAFLSEVFPEVERQVEITGSGPLNCHTDTSLVPGNVAGGDEAFQAEFCEPLNLFKVTANLVNIDEGVAVGMPAYTLANFYNPSGTGIEDPNAPAADDLMREPGVEVPTLERANPPISVQVVNGESVLGNFAGLYPAHPVASLFMATDVINEYAVGGAADAQTAWVVTFPTKNLYVDDLAHPGAPVIPFEELYRSPGRSCVRVDYNYYDREENEPSAPRGGVLPSPLPVVPIPEDSICQEAQVLNFGSRAVFDSQYNYVVDREEGYDSGWMRLGFPRAGAITDNAGTVFNGLPTIGFSMKTLNNGVLDNAMRTYGIMSRHAYQRDIR